MGPTTILCWKLLVLFIFWESAVAWHVRETNPEESQLVQLSFPKLLCCCSRLQTDMHSWSSLPHIIISISGFSMRSSFMEPHLATFFGNYGIHQSSRPIQELDCKTQSSSTFRDLFSGIRDNEKSDSFLDGIFIVSLGFKEAYILAFIYLIPTQYHVSTGGYLSYFCSIYIKQSVKKLNIQLLLMSPSPSALHGLDLAREPSQALIPYRRQIKWPPQLGTSINTDPWLPSLIPYTAASIILCADPMRTKVGRLSTFSQPIIILFIEKI